MGNVMFDSKLNKMKAVSGGMSPCLHWSPKKLDLTQLISLAQEDPPDLLEMGNSPTPSCEAGPHLHEQWGAWRAGPGPDASSLRQPQHSCCFHFHFYLL